MPKPEPSDSIPSQLASNASPNPLTPSRLSNTLPNTPTPLHLVDAFPTQCSFDLSSSLCQVDSRHPHSFPTQRSFDLSSSSRQVNSRHPHSFPTRRHSTFSVLASSPFPTFHQSQDCGQAKPDHVPPSLDASWSVFSHSLYICTFSMSHHSLPFICFLCLILSSPSPSTLVSSIFILTSINLTLVFHTFLTTHSRLFRSPQSLPHPARV